MTEQIAVAVIVQRGAPTPPHFQGDDRLLAAGIICHAMFLRLFKIEINVDRIFCNQMILGGPFETA